jgi:hypothetical protein
MKPLRAIFFVAAIICYVIVVVMILFALSEKDVIRWDLKNNFDPKKQRSDYTKWVNYGLLFSTIGLVCILISRYV